MVQLNFKNKWIIVTGASSGLGLAMARRLATKEQANLIITARREKRLLALKKELENKTSCNVHIIPADLSLPDTANQLFQKSTLLEDVYAIINNAGMTFYGFADQKHQDFFNNIIHVNFQSIMQLNLLFLTYFKEKGQGAILNVTSLGGSIPMPYQAVYAASKHATQAFTESLYQENRHLKNIVISCFAPGGIQTEMQEKSGLDRKIETKSLINMKPDTAARKAINGFKKRRYFVVPGIVYKSTLFMIRLFPRKWVSSVAEKIYRPPKDNQ